MAGWSRTTLLQVSSHLIAPSTSGSVPQDAPILKFGKHCTSEFEVISGTMGVLGSVAGPSGRHKALPSGPQKHSSNLQVSTSW